MAKLEIPTGSGERKDWDLARCPLSRGRERAGKTGVEGGRVGREEGGEAGRGTPHCRGPESWNQSWRGGRVEKFPRNSKKAREMSLPGGDFSSVSGLTINLIVSIITW